MPVLQVGWETAILEMYLSVFNWAGEFMCMFFFLSLLYALYFYFMSCLVTFLYFSFFLFGVCIFNFANKII